MNLAHPPTGGISVNSALWKAKRRERGYQILTDSEERETDREEDWKKTRGIYHNSRKRFIS